MPRDLPDQLAQDGEDPWDIPLPPTEDSEPAPSPDAKPDSHSAPTDDPEPSEPSG